MIRVSLVVQILEKANSTTKWQVLITLIWKINN